MNPQHPVLRSQTARVLEHLCVEVTMTAEGVDFRWFLDCPDSEIDAPTRYRYQRKISQVMENLRGFCDGYLECLSAEARWASVIDFAQASSSKREK